MTDRKQIKKTGKKLEANPSLAPILARPEWRELMLIHGAWIAEHLGSELDRMPDLRVELERWSAELGAGKSPLDPQNEPPDVRQAGLNIPQGGRGSTGTRYDAVESFLRPSMDLRNHARGAASTEPLKDPAPKDVPGYVPGTARTALGAGNAVTVGVLRSDGSTFERTTQTDAEGNNHSISLSEKLNGAVNYTRTTTSPDGRWATVTHFSNREGASTTVVRGDPELAQRTAFPHERARLALDPNPEALSGIPGGFHAPGQNPDMTPERSKVQADPGPEGAAPQPQAAKLRVPNLVADPKEHQGRLTREDAKRLMKNVPRIKTPGANPGDPNDPSGA